MKRILTLFLALGLIFSISASQALAAYESTFEAPQDIYTFAPLSPLGAESYWTGTAYHGTNWGDEWTGGFLDKGSFHSHYSGYDASYGYYNWNGFAYSNRTDNALTGMAGQYTAMPESGVNGSDNYAIGYVNTWAAASNQIYFGYDGTAPMEQNPGGAYFTNNAYAYHSMMNGDGFADRFGYGKFNNENTNDWDNPLGTNPDWFLLTIYGLDANYERAGSVEFYLADYRFEENTDDYIVTDWEFVDLSGLGDVYGLDFDLSSSDTGDWGMNTPAYFAMDAVPIPGAVWLLGSGLLALIGLRKRLA